MIERKSWEEFRECGMLWFINMILHTFGWAICVEVEKNENGEKVIGCYPARVRYRGFGEKENSEGYIKVAKYIKRNGEKILEEAEE